MCFGCKGPTPLSLFFPIYFGKSQPSIGKRGTVTVSYYYGAPGEPRLGEVSGRSTKVGVPRAEAA